MVDLQAGHFSITYMVTLFVLKTSAIEELSVFFVVCVDLQGVVGSVTEVLGIYLFEIRPLWSLLQLQEVALFCGFKEIESSRHFCFSLDTLNSKFSVDGISVNGGGISVNGVSVGEIKNFIEKL